MHFIVQYKHFRLQNVFLFFFFFYPWVVLHFAMTLSRRRHVWMLLRFKYPIMSPTFTNHDGKKKKNGTWIAELQCRDSSFRVTSWGGILSHESWNDQLFPQLVKWLSVMDAKRRLLLLCLFFIFQSQKLWPDSGTGGKTQTSPTLLAIVLQRLLIQLIAN